MIDAQHRSLILGLISIALTACGYTDAGSGTDTLEVNITMQYQATAADTTLVNAQINSSVASASTAVVMLTDTDNNQIFSVTQPLFTNYVSTIPGYHRYLQINVTQDSANNMRCQLEGPGRHTIAQPLSGSTQSLSDDLRITWNTKDGIRTNEVEINLQNSGFSEITTQDTGSFVVPKAWLQLGPEVVSVTRRTQINPFGATAGSLIQAEYTVSVNIQILAP